MNNVYVLLSIDSVSTAIVAIFTNESKAKKALAMYEKIVCWNRDTKVKTFDEWHTDFENEDRLEVRPMPLWTDLKKFEKNFIGNIH